jgi:hypothetical protein
MGGVIETAKQKVWGIINDLAMAKPTPHLRIGLIGYGNGMGPFRTFDLTDDLDEVYKNLMTFRDEGWGAEFVGLAIHQAAARMCWADGRDALKVLYVIGNETARQGPAEMDYATTAVSAINRGIIVNAIYCGNVDYQFATPTWREMARLGGGRYMEIAGEGGGVTIPTPWDEELVRLNDQLNTTYVGYGQAAPAAAAKQATQDANAAQLGAAVAADRAVAKSGALYRNAGWDLVDAVKDREFDLASVRDEDLPAEMRGLTPEQRKKFLDEKSEQRSRIQEKIRQLAAERARFIETQIKQKGLSTDAAFDEAVRRSLTEQAEAKGFTFEK